MTTCARSGRCSRRRRGPFSGRSNRRGEICQFDLWEPKDELPVGHGQTRRGWVVVACLGYSRAGAGALIFSKQTPDLLAGIARCLWSLGALPETLVWDRQSGLHARDGRPTDEFAAFCGALKADWFSASRPIRRPRASSSAFRTSSSAASSLAAASPTSATSICNSTTDSTRGRTRTTIGRCVAGQSTGCSKSAR